MKQTNEELFITGGFCCSANDARTVRAAILSLCHEVLSRIHELLVIISQLIFNRLLRRNLQGREAKGKETSLELLKQIEGSRSRSENFLGFVAENRDEFLIRNLTTRPRFL